MNWPPAVLLLGRCNDSAAIWKPRVRLWAVRQNGDRGLSMPTKRRFLRRELRGAFTVDKHFELHFGLPSGLETAFIDETDRYQTWQWYRRELLAYCRPGKRPAAWWEYEAGVEQPVDNATAVQFLYDAGALSEREILALGLALKGSPA